MLRTIDPVNYNYITFTSKACACAYLFVGHAKGLHVLGVGTVLH